MPSRRPKPTKAPHSLMLAPAYVVAGLLAGSARSINGLVPSASTTSYRWTASRGRGHQTRRGVRSLRLSASGGKGVEDMDSSELYADIRHRLEELRQGKSSLDGQEEGDSLDRRRDKAGGNGVEAYSGQKMKKAYYKAFWRAKNLNNEARFESGDQEDSDNPSFPQDSQDAVPASQPPSTDLVGHQSSLSPAALSLLQSLFDAPATNDVVSSDVQGLTQMYFLDEGDEIGVASAAAAAASVGGDAMIVPSPPEMRKEATQEGLKAAAAHAFAGDAVSTQTPGVHGMVEEPQGISQLFYLDPEEEEAAAAALPLREDRSFLREKFGVSGEIVRDLRQVELDHARLAMLAVLLSGVVGAGAGVPTSASFADSHVSLSTLAEVARTPWLDPCVAGVILTLKALSEGDWRLGKGALAGWADQTLRSVSESYAKVLRISGEEMRKLAVDMEVRHGRVALGAVVCAMAQQGLVSIGC